ncbi:ribosomal L7Ae/L30e/S12e/Gadd45 family protein [Candidatus Woesearchaeota archaeon]|nr:ribosomal L7Ae/L30e/S12e/Gadd45 family protein [Candidatus Woesearchaeota archaeon]
MSVDEIKKMLKSGSLVIGAESTVKALRKNELVKVFLASNAPEGLVNDIGHYAAIAKVEVERLEIPNDDLGVVCKKPFLIACIGLKQQAAAEKKKF